MIFFFFWTDHLGGGGSGKWRVGVQAWCKKDVPGLRTSLFLKIKSSLTLWLLGVLSTSYNSAGIPAIRQPGEPVNRYQAGAAGPNLKNT